MSDRLGRGVVVADRFEIERLVAHGGMGTVYRALDREEGLPVALKVVGLHFDSPEGAARFAQETELLARLSEPRIVRYVAHGETAQGEPYLAMQWLDGEDLRAALARGRLSPNDARSLIEGAAEALAALHARGVVHRDLKPGNLFLRGGSPADLVLLDFGLARRIEASRRLTATGTLLGTPHYMAPEQASSNQEIVAATDIFSLGCIFYECLTGRPPFDAAHVAGVLARILFEEPEPVHRQQPSVPEAWSALIARMLSKDPARRPRDAAALLEEIARLPPAGEDVGAQPVPPPRKGGEEQTLVCVVLATLPHAAGDDQPFALAQSALVRFGFAVELLANGSLIATLPSSGAATDQARIAAKGALHLHALLPGARIAVATGRALLGQTTRVGEAVDRAARLIESTGEDREGVWLDSVTAGLLEARFHIAPQPSGSFLLGERADADEGRLLLGKPTPCVGRSLELAQLEGLMARAVEDSTAQAVLVLGAAGTGKSRLRHEFARRLREERPEVEYLIGYGDPLTVGSPYGLVSDALRRHAGVRVGDDPLLARRMLAETLCRHVEPAHHPRVREFLGELCGVPFPAEDSPPLQAARSDPKAMSEQITLAFLDWLAAECRVHPVVVVLEDLQWGDALTVKLLEAALRDRAECPCLFLALGRPEVKEVFPGLLSERAQEVSLRPLGRKASELLVKGVLGQTISAETLARIVELAGGNALFLEELIRAAAQGQAGEVPETVLAMVQARIARLSPEARRALRAASIFGETFWQGAVQSVCEGWGASGDVASRLAVLVEAEIVERQRQSRFPAETEYKFRHALVRDAAYALLAERERELGHRQACQYLEQKGETDGMVLAEHAQRGGDLERAVVFYARAAEQSWERNDLEEVTDRAGRGIACGAEGEALGVLRAFQSLAAHGLGQWAASAEAGLEALALLPRGGVWWCRVAEKQINVLPMVGRVDRFQELVEAIRRTEPHQDARADYVCAASILIAMFGVFSARDEFQGVLAAVQQTSAATIECHAYARGVFEFGHGFGVWILEPDPYFAMTLGERSVAAAAQTGVPRNLCLPKTLLGMAQVALGGLPEGELVLRSNLEDAKRARDPYLIMNARAYLGWMLAGSAAPACLEEAEQLASTVLAANVGDSYTGIAQITLAEVYLARGQWAQAEAEARQARATLSLVPSYVLDALSILLAALQRQGRSTEAAAAAREGLALLARIGCGGWAEVRFRVAAAEAFDAAGEGEAARSELREALRQIALRADKIPDAAWKERFSTGRPENQRAFALAQAWQVD